MRESSRPAVNLVTPFVTGPVRVSDTGAYFHHHNENIQATTTTTKKTVGCKLVLLLAVCKAHTYSLPKTEARSTDPGQTGIIPGENEPRGDLEKKSRKEIKNKNRKLPKIR